MSGKHVDMKTKFSDASEVSSLHIMKFIKQVILFCSLTRERESAWGLLSRPQLGVKVTAAITDRTSARTAALLAHKKVESIKESLGRVRNTQVIDVGCSRSVCVQLIQHSQEKPDRIQLQNKFNAQEEVVRIKRDASQQTKGMYSFAWWSKDEYFF